MTILELPGPRFLVVYLAAMGIAAVAVALARWIFRVPAGGKLDAVHQLDPYEIAYLAGGESAAIDAAVASLVHNGILSVGTSTLTPGVPLPPEAHPLERSVMRAVELQGAAGATPARVRSLARGSLAQLAGHLKCLGFVVADEEVFDYRLAATVIWGVPLCLGAIKVSIGLSRGRPVEFLVILLGVTFVLAMVSILWRPHRTRRGDDALALLKRENAALEPAIALPEGMTGHDLAIALALFGAAALTHSRVAPLREMLYPQPVHSDSGCSSSSCSSSSCGGGCGGGGCGGCGS